MMNYVVISVFAIAVLTGLVGFGIGHRRQNWGTVAAAFLVLLTAAGYVYLAARLAAYEWRWEKVIRAKREQIAFVRDALRPDPAAGGALKPVPVDDAGNPKPLDMLAVDRERWQRALERVNTWRGRSWAATFQPPNPDPKAENQLGVIEITAPAPVAQPDAAAPPGPDPAAAVEPDAATAGDADGAPAAEPAADAGGEPAPKAEPIVPINPGATVYVFDDRPLQDGGRYVGAFLVKESAYDVEAGRYRITVARTAPPDAYDAQAWSQAYDAVTVYESLPVDRWLAFYETRADSQAEDSAVSPQPVKSKPKAEKVASDRGPLRGFLEEFSRHEQEQKDDPESWKKLDEDLDESRVLQGVYWAVVTFTEDHTFEGKTNDKDGGAETDDEATSRSFQAGDTAEFDLQTARQLEKDGKVRLDRVFYRRPLRDGLTLMYGSWVDAGGKAGILADGIAALLQTLRREIDDLEARRRILEGSKASVDVELVNVNKQATMLEEDMRLWDRDAKRAALVEAGFRQQLDTTRRSLADAEREIVRQGRELSDAMGRLVEKIDAAAPPADRTDPGAGTAP